jgi:hypothetical protein
MPVVASLSARGDDYVGSKPTNSESKENKKGKEDEQ